MSVRVLSAHRSQRSPQSAVADRSRSNRGSPLYRRPPRRRQTGVLTFSPVAAMRRSWSQPAPRPLPCRSGAGVPFTIGGPRGV